MHSVLSKAVCYELGRIAGLLNQKKIGLFPCDTVWGLVGCAYTTVGAEINRLKNRPESQPLIQLIGDVSAVPTDCLTPAHTRLMQQYWPGPVTLILPTPSGGIAYRQPDFEPLNYLLAQLERPLYSTSVNVTGESASVNTLEIPAAWERFLAFCFTGLSPGGGQASGILDTTQVPFTWIRH